MDQQSLTVVGTLYSAPVGFVFIFNLICGSGVLTMPKAFADAGWILSLISITVLAAVGYLTVTFLIESMAVANAMLKLRGKEAIQNKKKRRKKISEEKTSLMEAEESQELTYSGGGSSGAQISGGSGPIMSKQSGIFNNNSGFVLSNITLRVELGQMASMFCPRKYMVIIVYIMMCIYLFGDMAIYSVAVPKSLRHIACTYSINITGRNLSDYGILHESDPCWPGVSLTRMNAYRIFLAAFVLLFGPFIFFNVQKTKYLQIFTITTRIVSLSTMIILASIRLANGYGSGSPPVANFPGLPTLFGVCIYSFMTHHSLPSLVTPIRNKNNLYWTLGADYVGILLMCGVLSITGVFAFSHLMDLYTLNFFHDKGPHPVLTIPVLEYFLALFPVFTLSTSFPLIGVTLRNNLITLGHLFRDYYPYEKILFPLLAVLPPVAVAMMTTNVEFLVSITGSYAGAMIQYIIPVGLVYYARKQFRDNFGEEACNKHRSLFRHWFWIPLVVVWFVICIVFVTVNHILTYVVLPHIKHHGHHPNATHV